MASRNKSISEKVLIAVEGCDYLYSLLSQIRGRPEFSDVQLWDYTQGIELQGGVSQSNDNFDLLLKERGFKDVLALGIITDAEANRMARVQSVQGTLRKLELPVPNNPLEIAMGRPSTGYLVMPIDRVSGCLEHAMLTASTLPAERIACAEAYCHCILKLRESAVNENHEAKIKVHALIAGETGKSSRTLGESASAGLWNFDHPSLKVMLDFIQSLRKAAGL